MALLSRLLTLALALCICSLVTAEVLDHTVLSSQYIEQKAVQINAYNRLSTALSNDLAKNINDANVSESQAADTLKNILTPQVLQQKVNTALDGLSAYLRGSGTIPTINLSDLVAQAQANGIPISPDNQLSKPIVLVPNADQNKTSGPNIGATNIVLIIASVVLLGGLIFVCWKRGRYGNLADAFILAGVLLGISALMYTLSPAVVDHFVKFNFHSNAFASIGDDLAKAILRDVGRTIGIIAAIMFGAGLIGRLLLLKFAPKPKTPKATPKPAPAT